MYEKTSAQPDIPEVGGYSCRLRELLYARGARDEDAMEQFLHPSEAQFHDPFLLFDMDNAVRRIKDAIGRGKICVYGDYDADGVCATTIVYDCLRSMGADAIYRIPSRHEEGYGLNMAAVERLHGAGVKLIVTVDNGVKAYGEIERCRELGIDVVVTDHHQCDGRIPGCCAVVCHTRPEDEYPNKSICGAGIAWKLAEALTGRESAKKYLPLAGIATMADVVPLLGENRAIVALALKMLNNDQCSEGIKALGRLVKEKSKAFVARQLSFGFAPRLNAAGRMGDAGICVELLCGGDPKKSGEIAQRIDLLNRKRQNEEIAITDSASAMIEADDITEKRCIVLRSTDWNPGVVGIAASRIAERYYRPTLLFSENDGMLTGSARSIAGVDIYSALNANSKYFTRFGGHEFAAGVTMPVEYFDEFASELDKTIRQRASEELFIPRRPYEAEVSLGELTLPMVQELELLAPFGTGNPEPCFRTNGMLLRGVKRIGSSGSHIKATGLQDDRYIEMVAFSQGYRFDELLDMERCDALYVPSVNEWNGMRSVQLGIREIRSARLKDPASYIAARQSKFIDAFSRNVLYNKGCSFAGSENITQTVEDLLAPIAGTMILCFTSDGAKELLTLLDNEALLTRLDLCFSKNKPFPCAYHAAVLGPELDRLELSRYRDILLFDSLDTGIGEHIKKLAPGARLHYGKSLPLDEFSSLAMGREDMAVYYRTLISAERRFYNIEELADYLSAKTGKERYMARLSADIMAELGFISCEQGIRVVKNPPQRSLEESPTYAALQRLKTTN